MSEMSHICLFTKWIRLGTVSEEGIDDSGGLSAGLVGFQLLLEMGKLVEELTCCLRNV